MMDLGKFEAFINQPPTNVADLQVFFGLANFYSKHIQGYAQLMVPMID